MSKLSQKMIPCVESKELISTLKETHDRSLDYKDLFKLPTAISVSGLALVQHGCRNINTVAGVNYIAAGRGLDLIDGVVARSLHQESDAGALADATCDKLGMACIAYSALKNDAVPKYALGTMFASNLTSAGLTIGAGIRHPDRSYRPTKNGKHSMAAFNIGIISHLYANALKKERPELNLHPQFSKLGHVAVGVGIGLAIPSNIEYASRLR